MTTSVTVGPGDTFTPQAIQVSPGATVTWTFTGVNTHNVNFSSASIGDSGDQSSGAYATAMPATPGTYAYQCDHHSGMGGTVLVQ